MVNPLAYNSGLSLEDAVGRYQEVSREFVRVKERYTSMIGRFRRKMAEKDKQTLADCIGVLLPLSHEASVQNQVSNAPNIETTLFYRIGGLQYQIMTYMTNFRNTGVTVLKGSID